MELTNRQWRALAHALPYYFPSSPESEVGPAGVSYDSSSTQRAEFEQYVVPRARKAFQEAVEAWMGSRAEDRTTQSPVDAVEAVMAYLFGRAAIFSTSAPPTVPACAAAPLTVRELHLLRLYHRKQEQYEYVHSNQQQLLQASQTAVRALQAAAQAVSTDERVEEGKGGDLLDSARESLLWLGGAHRVTAGGPCLSSLEDLPATVPSAAGAGVGFTSALASVPYPSPAAVNSGSPFAGSRVPPSLTVVNRCAGCGEVDGDLLVCTQCGEVRHEACGGPHPPERSRVDGSLPSVNICRSCARALNLSSSSSSLRSSTSSSERAELDKYFDSEGETESSLSGFVVHSSDDEEDDDTEVSSSRSTRSQSPSSGGHGDSDEAREVARRGKAAAKGAHRQAGHAPMPNTKGRNKLAKRQAHRRSRYSSDGEEEEEPPRRQDKRRRNEEVRDSTAVSTREDEASSSLSDASSSGKRQQCKLHSLRGRTCAPMATRKPTAVGQQRNKGGEDAAPLSTQEKHSMQDEQDELTMLGIAADAKPAKNANTTLTKRFATSTSSADASCARLQPPQRAVESKKSFKSGRRSVVNIASSSSSSDSSD
ncbi:hypothetical protein ABL78_6425 [Leptomonas seymouri]|uniref:Uncharacterized protein n=1 Tax=Leptomonas seymouri TaxID=5684 RepID=A0A0N1I226_LEPSE|nr:hypothetical protein ABL78_6425 [Leptomonas seymouri]|eukprot:KPI84515.1 hypothetical protein ABL78_6425 [Leptomonas seymouri]